MNTDALRQAYADFLALAHTTDRAPAPNGGWSADMVLAHVIVGDRLIAQAAGRLMAGMPTDFDNLASQAEPYLQSVVEAAGSWEGLLEQVQRTADELIALVARMTDEQAAIPIASSITSDGTIVFDRTVPLATLVQVPAVTHLHMHLQQLQQLAGAGDHAHAAAVTT